MILWLEPSQIYTGTQEQLIEPMMNAVDHGLTLYSNEAQHRTLKTSTHPLLFKFFNSDDVKIKGKPLLWDSPMVMFNSESLQKDVMQWWLACSLDPNCIAPERASKTGCRGWGRKRIVRNKQCHFYDLSVLSVLLYNRANHDISDCMLYMPITTAMTQMNRKKYKPKICANNKI